MRVRLRGGPHDGLEVTARPAEPIRFTGLAIGPRGLAIRTDLYDPDGRFVSTTYQYDQEQQQNQQKG